MMVGPFVPGASAMPKGFRFALGTLEQPGSLVWRLWTRDDEVHVTVIAGGQTTELTVYPTGRWRIDIGGVVSRWHRPKPLRPGWTRGPDIVLPGQSAAAEPTPKAPPRTEPIAWLPMPVEGQVARIQLWFAEPGADERRWRDALPELARPIVGLPLRRAGSVHLVRVDEPGGSTDLIAASGMLVRRVMVSADQTGRPSFFEAVG